MANSINATSTGNGGIITTGDDSGVLNIQTNETTAVTIDASQKVSFTNNVNLPNTFGMKNRIINGDMRIDQRNAGASVTPGTVVSQYMLDRWAIQSSNTSKFSIQQNAGSVTPPAGFSNYVGITSLSAYSVAASDYFDLYQVIEGFNFADLAWGTASAAPITISFWARSSLTGTFGGSLRNGTANRSYPFTYTVNAANTWEQKTLTIAGDTTGTWATNNTAGLILTFSLGMGSNFNTTAGAWTAGNYISATGATSVVGTSGATWYITGVQLEKGTQATSFDFRSYGTELALCQRYYLQFNNVSTDSLSQTGTCPNTTSGYCGVGFPVQMRSVPTFSYTSLSNIQGYTFGGSNGTISTLALNAASPTGAMMLANFSTTVTTNVGFYLRGTGASSSIQFSAEI